MQTKVDHLVIGADNLTQGIAYVKETLGVDIPYGGVHAKLGTHNHLMQLGDDIFLEVIAINPKAASPQRPRWFGLDDPFVRRQLQHSPALMGWVISTEDIDRLLQCAVVSFGHSTRISRGNLSWHFGLPEDGRLLAGGMLPYAMQWHTATHPSRMMADTGCRFAGLEIYHPQSEWLDTVLQSVDAAHLVKMIALPSNSAPYLAAYIDTPLGIKVLRSDGK